MRPLAAFFLLSSLIFSACTPQGELAPLAITGFSLGSAAPAELADWYQDQLGFSIHEDGEQTSLKLNNISLNIAQTNLPSAPATPAKRLPGFFKLGFKTNQLDELYNQLKAGGSQFRGDIFYDQNLQMRGLVALDPDGNRVQFFEDAAVDGLEPYFFSVIAVDFEATKTWCESMLGLEELHVLDLPERGLFIRLLAKDRVLLELISDESMTADGQHLPGIEGVLLNRLGKRHGAGELRYTGL